MSVNCSQLQDSTIGTKYLVKRPKALQWFHNGVLVKDSEGERQAGRFELFLDLLCMFTTNIAFLSKLMRL